jgi:23S rRNA U2552 (ribose-2'-O)-methylase RlmE/FtsJ
VEGVIFVKDDLFAPDLESRIAIYSPDGFDLILSDILMHTSGDKSRDQANSFFICKRVLEICNVLLRRNGRVVAKTIQGDLTDELETEYRKYFRRVYLTKPPSSLPSSPEVYILGEGYSGH